MIPQAYVDRVWRGIIVIYGMWIGARKVDNLIRLNYYLRFFTVVVAFDFVEAPLDVGDLACDGR